MPQRWRSALSGAAEPPIRWAAGVTAISCLEIAVIAALGVAVVRLFFSNLNPLWHLWESWPRTLDKLSLHAKCDGLLRFGLPGAHWCFVDQGSRDRISIVKTSPPAQGDFELQVQATAPPTEWAHDFERVAHLALGDAGSLAPAGNLGSFTVSCSDSARLVALIRGAAKSLGHPPDSRYRTFSKGPVDYEEVNEYFGFR